MKNSFLKVQDYPGLVRDCSTNAILANNISEKIKFEADQKKNKEIPNKLSSLEEKVNSIEENLKNLETLLNQIINKLDPSKNKEIV